MISRRIDPRACVVVTVVVAVLYFGVPALFMLAWNWLAGALDWWQITYWQAVIAFWVISVLLGGVSIKFSHG
jgi:hypothetical protein